MQKSLLILAAFGASVASAEVEVKKEQVNVSAGGLVAKLPKARNYCPVMEGVGLDGRFGVLLQSMIWYHGRTGNAERFYQDQDEKTWPTKSLDVSDAGAVVATGTVDYDVRREVTVEPADGEALRLDYVLITRESRFYDPVNFPLLYFSKEAECLSYDDGHLGAFRTEANPKRPDLVRSRAFLLHFPKRGKTLLMLVDTNRPIDFGHRLGLAVTQSVNGWSRVFNFGPLGYEEFPFFSKDVKLGVRMWFKLLDGGSFSDAQAAAARKLAAAVGARDAAFGPEAFDDVFVRPSTLAAAMAAPDGISLWTETPMKRVYPNTQTPTARAASVKLESAANERESFQLVLRSEKDMRLESVRASDLVSAEGNVIAAKEVRIHRLGYERVADQRAVFCGETRFADRMIPVVDPVTLSANENAILHATVFAPPGTAAGTYRGEVALVADGAAIRVPVELKVWNVELPRETAYIGHMLVWNSPYAWREEVLRRFAECGMMGTIYTGEGSPKLKSCFDGKAVTMPDGFALAEKSVKELGAPYFNLPWGFMGAWNWNTNKTVFLGLDLKLDSQEFDDNFSNYLTSVHGQLAARGIVDRSFIYMWDEMTEGHYAAMRKTTAMVRKYAPGVKILTVSAPDPEVVANNDIIVAAHPAHWWSDEGREVARRINTSGKRLWMYANSVTFGTASRSLVPRLTPWLCRAHGMSGYLHWSCDYNWKANDFAKNGKEWLLYPSSGEPVYSVRMEYFRDGVEDFNLMQLARRLPKDVREKLERVIAEVASDHSALRIDPAAVARERRMVAEALTLFAARREDLISKLRLTASR